MLPPPPIQRMTLPAPNPPSARPPFPWAATVAPVVVSIALWVFTQSIYSLMFALLGPLVAAGGMVDGRVTRRRAARRDGDRLAAAVERIVQRITAAQRSERQRLSGLLARPTAPVWDGVAGEAIPVSVGTGTVTSTVELAVGEGEEHSSLAAVAAADLIDAPVLVDARDGIGVVGSPVLAAAVARSLAVQVASRLSPESVALSAPDSEAWAGSLPHAVASCETGEYRWSGEGIEVLIAWAPGAHELPLGCGVVVTVGTPAGVDGAGVPAQDAGFVPTALGRQGAERATQQLRERSAVLGIRARDTDLPDRVDAGDLLVDRAAGGAAAAGLAAPIGHDGTAPVIVDLIAQGPHALVAGTTGSGKSELLVAWVLGLAHGRSPDEVSFLLIDFKGGAAFTPLAHLPHVLATLSDLDARLTRRAIESLRSELLRRERLLAAAGARAIDDLPLGALARLVIVVDEFAAVVASNPELHEVFADLAARGRSLGMHLVLCTQRPAGVVRDAVLANIGLRVSLRVTDRADSMAMVDDDAAARLPTEPRGRAIIFVDGASRMFQVAIATSSDADRVAAASAAASTTQPWCEPLPLDVALEDLPPVDHGLAFGLVDLPEQQRQPPAVHDPRHHGHLLVLGAAGSGVTTALCTLVASARRDGMNTLVLSADPAQAWAQLSALAGRSGSRALLVIDDLDALLARFEPDYRHGFIDLLTAVLREPDGPDAVAGARRLTSAMVGPAGLFGSRLLLRQATRDDHALAGGTPGGYDPDLPPGSGTWRGAVVQVARCVGAEEGARLPAPVVPDPVVVTVAAHPVLAVVAARPRVHIDALRAAGARVIQLGRDAAPDPDGLHVATAPTPTVLIGDPDAWQGEWSLLTTARREWPIVLIGCAPADLRALTRDRDLPPPLGSRPGECWLAAEGRTVRAVLNLMPLAPFARESEENGPSNR